MKKSDESPSLRIFKIRLERNQESVCDREPQYFDSVLASISDFLAALEKLGDSVMVED